jgi:hypothetical protein
MKNYSYDNVSAIKLDKADQLNTKQLSQNKTACLTRLDGLGRVIRHFQDQGLNITTISRLIGCSRQTLNNWLAHNSAR